LKLGRKPQHFVTTRFQMGATAWINKGGLAITRRIG
jgi:hypothetical protein